MQDCAPPDSMTKVKKFLKKTLSDERVLSRHFTHEWPPRSLELMPTDFRLWSYVKTRVCRNSPSSLVELKDAISHDFSSIHPEILYVQ